MSDTEASTPRVEQEVPEALLLGLVFLTALSLIFLESVLFHALLFVASYVVATMAIPVALLGISVGGLLVFLLADRMPASPNVLGGLLGGLALGFPVVYVALALLSSNIFSFPIPLLVPFAVGSMVLSLFFVHARSSEVYFADLVGAGCGAALAAPALEYIGLETSMFLGGAVLATAGALFPIVTTRKFGVVSGVVGAIAVLLIGVTAYQGATDDLNLIYTAQGHKSAGARAYRQMKQDDRELVYTNSSASGRTDAVAKMYDNGNFKSVTVFHDGLPSDSFKFRPYPQGYRLDPRVPWGLIEDPDSLIIGTSAEGVVGAVAGMGAGEIHGLEICTGKADIMITGIGKELTNDVYQVLDELSIMDARTYLNLTDNVFDHYTMMNAHLGQRLSRAAAPEYLHTQDSFVAMFEHLSDRGFLNIEETSNRDSIDDPANIKLANTLVHALMEIGSEDPGAHMYVFRWSTYIQYFVKKTPFTDAELEWLDDWIDKQVMNTVPVPFVVSPNVVWHPKKKVLGPIAEMIRTKGEFELPGYNLAPSTDDRPFGFDVLPGRPLLWQALSVVAGLAFGLVMLPIAVLLFWRLPVKPVDGVAMYAYFGGLGLGYLLIEILLIQWLQRYIGTPAGSVIAILGGMLVFSGIGSFVSPRLGRSKASIIGVFIGIAAIATVMLFALPPLLDALAFGSLALRMLTATLLVAPLAFLMGMPFPMGLAIAKERTDPRAGALMFALNGAFSALASPIAMLIAMDFGFQVTLIVGTVLYVAMLGLILVFDRKEVVA